MLVMTSMCVDVPCHAQRIINPCLWHSISPRVFVGGQMILFGGYGAGARLNDPHILDLTSWQWQQPSFTGTAPLPRQSCGIALQGDLTRSWCVESNMQ